MSTIALSTGLSAVRAEIARACREARRDPASVTLVAVSKTFDADAIEPVIDAGQRVFGENRVQEAKAKWPPLLASTRGLELHMIGPLQSNKAKEAVALFDAIHSVDRAEPVRGAGEGDREGRTAGRSCSSRSTPAREAQKAGVLPQDADAFLARCRDAYGLAIGGLMCIPPADEAPAPHFALTAKIAARNGLQAVVDGHERGLSGRDRDGRDAYPRRQRDLRRADAKALIPTRAEPVFGQDLLELAGNWSRPSMRGLRAAWCR